MIIALQSPVRRKTEEERKGKFTFSLGKDLYRHLQIRAEEDGRSVSSMVERILREALGLTKQTNPGEEGE